ncbi:MAG: class I SAM-dependent methyltransferase [Steroidobacteraceae bacterium]
MSNMNSSNAKCFSYDWFSWKIPTFQKHLSHLKGKKCSILEIGTHEGRSASWLLENIATHEQSNLVCLDISEQPVWRHNIRASNGESKTELRLGFSSRTLRELEIDKYDVTAHPRPLPLL